MGNVYGMLIYKKIKYLGDKIRFVYDVEVDVVLCGWRVYGFMNGIDGKVVIWYLMEK